MKNKKFWAILLTVAMIISMFAYSASATETKYIAPKVSVSNFDPVSLTCLRGTGNGKNVLNEIYETLLDRNGFGTDVYGVLAKDWYWEGNDLYLDLYDYIHDQAGNPITAADVAFSFVTPQELGYTNNRLALYTTYAPDVENSGVEAVSDYQVVFHFKAGMEGREVMGGWLDMICSQPIFSKAAWEASTDQMAEKAVGTGMYTVKEVVSGAYYVLERYDDYWQTDESLIGPQHQANVQEITFKIINDPQQVVNALKTGEIDFANNIRIEAVPEFQNADEFTVASSLDNNIFALLPNCLEGLPLHDMNLRAALFYAINVDDIVAAIGGADIARKVFCFGIPKAAGYNPDWEAADNYYTKAGTDMAVAQEYMAKSNYNGETLKIWYEAGTYKAPFEMVALLIGKACEDLGIKYEIHTKDSQIQDVYSTTNSDWDLIIYNIGGNGTILDYSKQTFNSNFYVGGAGCWNDPTLDQIFAETFSESGATQENINTFMNYITDNYYIYGLYQITTYDVFRKSLIADASVKTFRTWIIPGSFEYVQP